MTNRFINSKLIHMMCNIRKFLYIIKRVYKTYDLDKQKNLRKDALIKSINQAAVIFNDAFEILNTAYDENPTNEHFIRVLVKVIEIINISLKDFREVSKVIDKIDKIDKKTDSYESMNTKA